MVSKTIHKDSKKPSVLFYSTLSHPPTHPCRVKGSMVGVEGRKGERFLLSDLSFLCVFMFTIDSYWSEYFTKTMRQA